MFRLAIQNRLKASLLIVTCLWAWASCLYANEIVVERFESNTIQQALDDSQPGDVVKLQEGIYYLNQSLKLKSNSKLIGAGQDKTFLQYKGEQPGVMIELSNCTDVELAHFTLEGNRNPKILQGITGGNASKLFLHDLTIKNLIKTETFGPHGILFSGENPTRKNGVTDSIIANCRFENIGAGASFGGAIRLAWGSSRNQILNNTIRKTGRGGIFGDNGSTDLVIRGNRISGSGGEGLGIEVWVGCDRSVIEDNQLDHWISVGGCDYCALRRNTISDKSGEVKYIGMEIVGSFCIVTDNVVDDGQQLGISVSDKPRKEYVYWANNQIQNCVQWGAQLQGEKTGISHHYFYRCEFNGTTKKRGQPAYPGDEGHGFRMNGNVKHMVFEDCQFSRNSRIGIQPGVQPNVDFLHFIRCTITDNITYAVSPMQPYSTLEWENCIVRGNGNNDLPPDKPFITPPPLADFDVPPHFQAGTPVHFISTSNARTSDGTISTLLWDFNQGPPVTGSEVQHTFTKPGSYRIALLVWDQAGRADRCEKIVTIPQ
jgi:hypothetical protein